MDLEILIKIVGAAVAIIGAGRVIYEIIAGTKPKLRDEYKFAKEFLSDLASNKELHPFVIEKGYQAIAGTTSLKGEEVAYILTLENPGSCLKDFVLSKKYIEHLNTTGDLQIAFAEKYRSTWSRNWRKGIYLVTYFLLAFGAMSPLLLAKPFNLPLKHLLAALAFTLPIFGYYALSSIRSFVKIYRGEKLVQNQKKHTQRIIIPR